MPPSHVQSELTRQRGAAMMVMLVIMILGATAFLVSSLSSSALKTARQETNASALAQAKEALLGYAVSNTTRPGELPCPDSDDDGALTINVDYVGNSCTTLLGRLPWKTLGVTELRDASGEKLWYAVSDPFHANASATLNSDTAGTITVSGNIADNNVIAIVFAPGANLPGQDRSAANINSYSHYLESVVTEFTAFILSTTDDVQGGNYSYNDQMILITHDNLFQTTEKAVGEYLKDSLLVNTYYTTWGALPFASALNTTTGLLPISGNAPTPYWTSIVNTGAGGGTCTKRPSGCLGSACTYARCSSLALSAGDVVQISGTVNDVGMGFWRPYSPITGSDHTSSCTQEVCVRIDIGGTNWYYPASSIMDNVQVIPGALDSNGRATITFIGTVKSGFIPDRIQFSTGGLPDYSSTLLPSWFASNNWQDVIYYAVSPGYAPGGGNDCEPLGTTPHVKPYCLTMNGGDDKHAIIIMTGSVLAGKTHPSAAITDYMEGENASPADYIFENASRTSSFNDHATSVAP